MKNPANVGIKITNGPDGNHSIDIPASSDITASSMVPIPSAQYNLSMNIYVPPESPSAKLNVQFQGTSLYDNAHLPPIVKNVGPLTPGMHAITFTIDPSEFQNVPAGTFVRPDIYIGNAGEQSFTIFEVMLTSTDASVYDQINSINPYDSTRSWYAPTGFDHTYDFTAGSIGRDWAVSLTGNAMFSPGAPAENYTSMTTDGIQIKSVSSNGTHANGGFQSTQFVPGGKNFTITMKFTATTRAPPPTNQRLPCGPMVRRNRGQTGLRITPTDQALMKSLNLILKWVQTRRQENQSLQIKYMRAMEAILVLKKGDTVNTWM